MYPELPSTRAIPRYAPGEQVWWAHPTFPPSTPSFNQRQTYFERHRLQLRESHISASRETPLRTLKREKRFA